MNSTEITILNLRRGCFGIGKTGLEVDFNDGKVF